MNEFSSGIWTYLKTNKRWWLLPLVIMSVLVGVLLYFGRASQTAPFVYPIF